MTADYPDLHVPAKEVRPDVPTFPVTRTVLDAQLRADTAAALALVREHFDPGFAWAVSSQLTWMSAAWVGQERILREFVDGINRQVARTAPRTEEAA